MEKIKEIQCYQAVKFYKTAEFHFTSLKNVKKESVDLKVIENTFVEIKNENDHILIPLSNVKCIRFYNEDDAAKAAHRKLESEKKPVANKLKRPR